MSGNQKTAVLIVLILFTYFGLNDVLNHLAP